MQNLNVAIIFSIMCIFVLAMVNGVYFCGVLVLAEGRLRYEIFNF